MKFVINSDFEVLVFPNKLNTIVKEDTVLEYKRGEEFDASSGVKFEVLKKAYDGDLLPFEEYQIKASVPTFGHLSSSKSENDYYYLGSPIIEITEFSQLQGDNPIDYPFLTVIE